MSVGEATTFAFSTASNLAAAGLLVRLQMRCALPWFRGYLACLVGEFLALNWTPRHSTAYGNIWAGFETLLVLFEAASVLELTSLLLRGRLNSTLRALRWFGLAIAAASFLAAALPLLKTAGPGWGTVLPIILKTRGYLVLGILFFLAVVWRILVGQPAPVIRGIARHGRLLAVLFALTAADMFITSYFPNQVAMQVATPFMASYTMLSLVWIWALWDAPLDPPPLNIDKGSASEATEKYRKFRDEVRTLKTRQRERRSREKPSHKR